LRRALKASPRDTYILHRLCDLETGEVRIHDLELLFDLSPDDASVGLDLLTALFAAKRPEDATQKARVLQTRFHDNSLVLLEAGRTLRANGQPQEALKLDERALQLDPDNLDALIAYADDLRAAGRAADATQAYFRLVAKNPTPTGYQQLIGILAQRNAPEDLKRAYQEALVRQPDDDELRRDFARWLASTKAVDEALKEWNTILAKSKNAFLREYADREIKRLETQKLLNR
jgi:tetratricopeptide (TPR) repeat protein